MIGSSYETTGLQLSVDGVLKGAFKVLKAFGVLSEYGNQTADDEVASYARLGPFVLFHVIGYLSLVWKA